jgi:hypothetical protein
VIRATVARHPGTAEERIALLESLVKKLESEFREARTAEYESSQVKILKKHHCTVGRGIPGNEYLDCGEKCAEAPNSDLYTKPEWLCFTGTQKGIEVTAGGRNACLRMTPQTKGVNRGGIHVLFKYKPEAIAKRVASDWTTLYSTITRTGSRGL